ncbi:MAG TPA: glycosyl hydrolase [Acidobacteriaceae bacterium]|jgi:hypothetical protein|nr:glycosyl hydrolase [Acidobacteriaceae bacterium]
MMNPFAIKKDRTNRRAAMAWGAIAACVFLLQSQPSLAQSNGAQHPWQKMQMPTVAEVKQSWEAPPPEYGPEPYYGLNGLVDREVLSRDLDKAVKLGFHAVTVQPGRGNKEAYLSPEYFAMFKVLVEEAKKRDLRVWIIDDAGYPSGFAGGLITDKTPELRMQALTIAQTLLVKGGETLKQTVGPDSVAATATNVAGEHAAVPIVSRAIAWTAPPGGDWTVRVVDHVFRTSPTASATNLTHLKDTTQSVEDYMDPAATAAWIQFTHEGYYKAMPEEFGKTIIGFRGDEPDYSISGLPWTPKFFDNFQQVKGYDIRPYLGALLLSAGGGGGRPRPAVAEQGAPTTATPAQATLAPTTPPAPPIQLTDAEVRAKGDYYDVFSQMFRDGFFKPQGLWCAAHGVEYQVHLNHEEMEMQLVRSEGEFERDMKYVQVPGIDAIWHQIWTDTIADYPRLASSTAHIYGHPRSFTESFGAYRPVPDVTMARYVLNEQIIRGINLTEGMSYGASSPPDPQRAPPAAVTPTVAGAAAVPPRPPSAMSDPAWPTLMDYIRRLSYVMSMGRPAAQVALYIPSSSMWLGDSASDTAFVSAERMLAERQIDFDIINLDALATDLKNDGRGRFVTMSGNLYRVVILPSLAVISQAELDRLKVFAKEGGKVLFLGRTPTLISQKTMMDSRMATPEDFAWATVETSAQLPPTPTPPANAPATPPGPLVVPEAIETALNKVIGTREINLDSPDPALKVMTRQLKDAKVYLFFNEGAKPISHTVTFNAACTPDSACGVYTGTGLSAFTDAPTVLESWDPETGTITPVAWDSWDKYHISGTLKLELKPYETDLLIER